MSPRGYYQCLSLEPEASPREVRRAYRRALKRYHPDTNPGATDTQQLQLILEAGKTLCNPQLRHAYDRQLRIQKGRPRPKPPAQTERASVSSLLWRSWYRLRSCLQAYRAPAPKPSASRTKEADVRIQSFDHYLQRARHKQAMCPYQKGEDGIYRRQRQREKCPSHWKQQSALWLLIFLWLRLWRGG